MALIKNTSFYTLGTILPKIGAFVFLPIYLKHMTPADYGIISSLYIFGTVLTILFTLSIPRALYRVFYDYTSDNEKKQLIGTSIISVLFIAIISFVLLLVFSPFIGSIYTSIPFYPYFLYAILGILFIAFHSIPQAVLQIRERALTFVLLNLSLFFTKSLFILYNVVYLKKGAIGYLEADFITDFVFIPVYYFMISKDIVIDLNFTMLKNLLLFSIPIIPGMLSSWVLNLSDRIFIERYFDASQVGIYSLGYQIAGLVLMFTSAFKSAYDPYFYKIANTYEPKGAKEKLYKTNYIFVLILIFVTFVIAFFSKEAIQIFFSTEYSISAQVVPLVLLGYLFSQNSALLNNMVYQMKKSNVIMYITLFSAFLNMGLNFLLIPMYGIMGAAWTTAISFLVVFILSYLLAKRHFFIPYNWKIIIPSLLFFIGIYIVFSFISIESPWVSIGIKSVIIALIVIPLVYRNRSQILETINTR